MIFRQGDPADAFYLVRDRLREGVAVPAGRRAGPDVPSGRASYFGEIGLLSHLPELRDKAPAGTRTATCTALDHVDLVRIKAEDFQHILATFPRSARSTS